MQRFLLCQGAPEASNSPSSRQLLGFLGAGYHGSWYLVGSPHRLLAKVFKSRRICTMQSQAGKSRESQRTTNAAHPTPHLKFDCHCQNGPNAWYMALTAHCSCGALAADSQCQGENTFCRRTSLPAGYYRMKCWICVAKKVRHAPVGNGMVFSYALVLNPQPQNPK